MSVTFPILAEKFSLNLWIVKSWCENMGLTNQAKAEEFFRTHEDIIKARPFVKWVGGKRQLIKQFEQFFPTEFGDYFEPFLGGSSVFQK